VARLRAAGAEVFCKTNLLEYAAGSVNPAYGMTFNPRDPSRTSGGSSSGSAALVAAGVCDYALGTDTGGSIRIPAAYCGIVGLKPSYGLVPVDGVFPLSPSCDHVGTLTATVGQTARLLAVLSGRRIELQPVGSVRVGVVRRQLDDPDLTPGVRARVLEALDVLRTLGAELVDVDFDELDLVDDALAAVVLREAWDVHRELYERERDGYGAGTRALLELGSRISDDEYRGGLDAQRQVARAFERVFGDVDVLAGPTVAYAAPAEDPPFGAPEGEVESRYTAPYNLSGSPAVSVPCGIAEGTLPAGLQLAAAHGRDAFLLAVARAYEEAAT
jgi:aspartyl-tRNA(Asn)/glutamyl-tRNA(Gln) amidotransferase subunit A